jgi:hypothetical protein
MVCRFDKDERIPAGTDLVLEPIEAIRCKSFHLKTDVVLPATRTADKHGPLAIEAVAQQPAFFGELFAGGSDFGEMADWSGPRDDMARGREPKLECSRRLRGAAYSEAVEQFGVQRPTKYVQRHFFDRRSQVEMGRHNEDLAGGAREPSGGGL